MRWLLDKIRGLFYRQRDDSPTGLTERQKKILAVLVAACERLGNDGSFVHQTEWLGYLPYGQYQWVKVGDKSISNEFPQGWEYSDLEALVAAGMALKVGERTPGEGGADEDVLYRLLKRETLP